MILAGDIGGTKTLLGLFDAAPARPRPIAVRDVRHARLSRSAVDDRRVPDGDDTRHASTLDRACFGVAGPVSAKRPS